MCRRRSPCRICKAVTVESRNAFGGAKPDKPARVLPDFGNVVAQQSVGDRICFDGEALSVRKRHKQYEQANESRQTHTRKLRVQEPHLDQYSGESCGNYCAERRGCATSFRMVSRRGGFYAPFRQDMFFAALSGTISPKAAKNMITSNNFTRIEFLSRSRSRWPPWLRFCRSR